MILEDWRDADRATVERLYAIEHRRWLETLNWDTTASWAIVEEGRRRGYVPGWILRDSPGNVAGWTYYVLHDGDLQIGGLTAERATATRDLLDRVLESPEAQLAASVTGFVFPAPPSLVSALTRRRFAVRRSLYLRRDSAAAGNAAEPDVPDARLRPFDERDVFPAMRLLAAAYDGVAGAECFAPHGRLEEWMRYIRQLIETPACGRWCRDSSVIAEDAADGQLIGLVLATALSPDTGHIAQVVVGRGARGRGVGEALVTRACALAGSQGRTSMTLMVDEENAPARRLYDRLGFRKQSAFVFGRRRGRVRMPAAAAATRRPA